MPLAAACWISVGRSAQGASSLVSGWYVWSVLVSVPVPHGAAIGVPGGASPDP